MVYLIILAILFAILAIYAFISRQKVNTKIQAENAVLLEKNQTLSNQCNFLHSKINHYSEEIAQINEQLKEQIASASAWKEQEIESKKAVQLSQEELQRLQTTAETTDSARMNIEASAFYFKDSSSCPNKGDLKKMSDSDTETYADPAKEARVASSSTNVSKTFDSDYCFVFEGFHQTLDIGESYVKNGNLVVKKNSYLYLRIENNSALNRDMTPLDISFINLLVRAV